MDILQTQRTRNPLSKKGNSNWSLTTEVLSRPDQLYNLQRTVRTSTIASPPKRSCCHRPALPKTQIQPSRVPARHTLRPRPSRRIPRRHPARKHRLLRLKTRMKKRPVKPPSTLDAPERPHKRRREQRTLQHSFSSGSANTTTSASGATRRRKMQRHDQAPSVTFS